MTDSTSKAKFKLIAYPAKDTYIDFAASDKNFGYLSPIFLGASSIASVDFMKILLFFDLSSITGKSIDSALLNLYCQEHFIPQLGDDSFTINVHRILSRNWTETGVTWITYNGMSQWTAWGGEYDETVLSTVTGNGPGWIKWDVKGSVQEFASGTYPYYGWILRSPSKCREAFVSKKCSAVDPTYYPRLEVLYH
jgi:hypothetical protein